MRIIEIGVREFITATLKVGGISAEFTPRSRALTGTLTHIAVTSGRPEGYESEVFIRQVFEWEGYRLIVRGRMDGLTLDEDVAVVEEIKSTFRPLATIDPGESPHHLAQLRLYQYFASQRYADRDVVPLLTYVHPVTLEERTFTMDWHVEESRRFFEALAVTFLGKERAQQQWRAIRDKSLRRLPFPFDTLRQGQTELIETVSTAITRQRDLLVQAATGIGKTMGVLYPAIRNLARHKGYARIFYLTAKSAGAEVARQANQILRGRGMRLRVLYLTAKDRICPLSGDDKPECQEGDCPFADDFYERVEQIIPELLAEEEMTPELILRVAQRECLCPFELSLELSLYADLIVCDYNYVFDPGVYLRRFFSPGLPSNYLFLVDEAHNLVPRSREMYSAALTDAEIVEMRDLLGSGRKGLSACIGGLLAQFTNWRETMQFDGAQALRLEELPADIPLLVEGVLEHAGEALVTMHRGKVRTRLLELYVLFAQFSRAAQELSHEYAIYVIGVGKQLRVRLLCLHPGPLLRQRHERSSAVIFFSATLSPPRYFRDLLGAREGCGWLDLPSPFPPEHRLYLHVPEVSTRYVSREQTKPSIAQVIAKVARARRGNYLAFFPSYAYLGAVWAEMMLTKSEDLVLHAQQPGMSREQQAAFLQKVCESHAARSNVGLAVMGGLFGEALDLPGEQLIGTIIVGPGLPGVSHEQELIREYFDLERDGEGFFYAYAVPGIIRVIQAAGRVFRTPEDTGVVVLLDDRFLEEPYRDLLPPDWCAAEADFSATDYPVVLDEFWTSVTP